MLFIDSVPQPTGCSGEVLSVSLPATHDKCGCVHAIKSLFVLKSMSY